MTLTSRALDGPPPGARALGGVRPADREHEVCEHAIEHAQGVLTFSTTTQPPYNHHTKITVY
jgi:hypothetical protein